MSRPANLHVARLGVRPKPKAEPAPEYHAAVPGQAQTLCGKHGGLSLVATWELVQLGQDNDGNPIHERWPKHWPSTDNRPVCASCVGAAELMWRRVDREPNVHLLNDAAILKRLAGPFTEALAEVKDRQGAIGYPAASSRGGGGVGDDTGYHATQAQELADWIDAVRDVKAQIHDDVLELVRLVARYAPKAEHISLTYCGDTQRKMTEAERAGWTQDYECRRYGTRSSGLCDRCGKRHDAKAERAA